MLTVDFFTGPLHLADLSDETVGRQVEAAITRYETEYLEKTLGVSFAATLQTALAGGQIEQRWIDLRDGNTWTYNGQTHRWGGLRNLTTLQSPIAGYVWWNYVRDTLQPHTSLGISQGTVENGQIVDPRYKATQVWNAMVRETRALVEYLTLSTDVDGNRVYPEYIGFASTPEVINPATWRGYATRRLPETLEYTNSFGI